MAIQESIERPKKPEVIVSVVKGKILVPIDGRSWDDVGPILRKLRWAAHRCLNAAMRACLVADYSNNADRPALGTLAYRAANEQVAREKEYDPDFSVASEIVSTWSKLASDAYSARRKDIRRGDQSVPSYRKGAPIMVRTDAWDLVRDSKGYVLSTRLVGGKTGRFRFAIALDGAAAHGLVRLLLQSKSDARRADLKILYDDRKKDWTVRMTIVRPKPLPATMDTSRKLAVHRGMRTLITSATSDGDLGIIESGAAIAAFKRQMFARRRDWYSHKRANAKRSRGRGYWRRYEMYRALEDKEKRFVDTNVRQIASRIVGLAILKGCGTIVLDDWSSRQLAVSNDRNGKEFVAMLVRQWPFAQQRSAIEQAAAKAGIAVEIVESAWESCTCPACGKIDALSNSGRGMFKCTECGLHRDVEQIAAWNMLAAVTPTKNPAPFDKNSTKRAAVANRLRERASAVVGGSK